MRALIFALLLAVWPSAVSAGNLPITALEIAEEMRSCAPIVAVEVDEPSRSARLYIEDYKWDGGTIMPNDAFMMGNTQQAIHPSRQEWAIVFPRTFVALDQSPDGFVIHMMRGQIIRCFSSTFPS